MTTGIYRLLFNNTDQCYIGQSVNIEKRFTQHIQSFNNRTASTKLLNATDKYGYPILDIILECKTEELDALEEQAISIFNSVENGFNTYSTTNQAPVLKGTEAGNAKYSKELLIQVFKYLADTLVPIKDIEKITKVSAQTIRNISNATQHSWLKEELPDFWDRIQKNKGTRKTLENYSRAEYNKSNYSAKSKGIVYPKILSPQNIVYNVDCVQEFARTHGISKSSLHRVLTKQVKSCKGWRLENHV